jgi:hypothetical protein
MLRGRLSSVGVALAGVLVLALPVSAGQPGTEQKAKRPVVVELYTSQGCSSCPPADALLGQLAARKDVVALSFPVTYWDMLGWRDTLASDGNTKRQKQYAKELGRGGVYTPQMIVDGLRDVIGSREQAVQSAIAARLADAQGIAVDLDGNRQQVRIEVGQATDRAAREATIWLFRVQPQATVSIGDGENSGRTITYRNVVRDIKAVGTWKGQSMTVTVPRAEAGNPHEGIAVVVQQGGYGRVVGAALIGHPNYYYVR